MSNQERTRILQMVAGGTISPAEADDLLSALEARPDAEQRAGVSGLPAATFRTESRRHLVIRITESGENKVNLRIPLTLARVATRFIPRQAQVYLNSHEINVPHLLESLSGSDDDGTLLEVNDGEDKVLIALE